MKNSKSYKKYHTCDGAKWLHDIGDGLLYEPSTNWSYEKAACIQHATESTVTIGIKSYDVVFNADLNKWQSWYLECNTDDGHLFDYDGVQGEAPKFELRTWAESQGMLAKQYATGKKQCERNDVTRCDFYGYIITSPSGGRIGTESAEFGSATKAEFSKANSLQIAEYFERTEDVDFRGVQLWANFAVNGWDSLQDRLQGVECNRWDLDFSVLVGAWK